MQTVNGSIIFSNNDAITATSSIQSPANGEGFTGFRGLSKVTGSFTITENAGITNLNFIGNVPESGLDIDGEFIITNNAALGDCCQPTCRTTVGPDNQQFDGTNSFVTVSGNTGDCADKNAVVAACSGQPGKDCLNAAPVDFVAFNGNLSGDHVTLDWATATETENDYFQVERSNDGLIYTAIGRVTGAGDSQDELSYTYLDYDYQPGANYYRLRQVDFDGTEDFSDVIQVTAPTASTSFAIFPNPATTSGAINFQMGKGWELERVTVDIFSASGRLVTTLSGASGLNRPIGELATGIYAVRVSDGKQTVTERLIVR